MHQPEPRQTAPEKTIAERIVGIIEKRERAEGYAWEGFWGTSSLRDRYNLACRYISRFGGSVCLDGSGRWARLTVLYFPDGSGLWAGDDESGYIINGRPGRHTYDGDHVTWWTNCRDAVREWARELYSERARDEKIARARGNPVIGTLCATWGIAPDDLRDDVTLAVYDLLVGYEGLARVLDEPSLIVNLVPGPDVNLYREEHAYTDSELD